VRAADVSACSGDGVTIKGFGGNVKPLPGDRGLTVGGLGPGEGGQGAGLLAGEDFLADFLDELVKMPEIVLELGGCEALGAVTLVPVKLQA